MNRRAFFSLLASVPVVAAVPSRSKTINWYPVVVQPRQSLMVRKLDEPVRAAVEHVQPCCPDCGWAFARESREVATAFIVCRCGWRGTAVFMRAQR